jgi:hypothetical protein
MPHARIVTIGTPLRAVAQGDRDFASLARGRRAFDAVARGTRKSRLWQVKDATGQDLGLYEGTSADEAVARMRTTLGPKGHAYYTPWTNGFGIPFGRHATPRRATQLFPSAREFPLGFFNPSVGTAFGVPGTPAQEAGSVSLLSAGLYGPLGSLAGTILHFTINGGATVTVILSSPDPTNATTLLAAINAVLIPAGAIATSQSGTNFILFTTFLATSGASMLVSGDALSPLGLPPPALITGTDPVPAVGAVNIISQPQLRFRGERLVIPSSIAPSFTVLDIKVGNKSQIAGSTVLPASTFVEGAVGVRLGMDTATIAQDISLTVQNTSATSLPFMASLIGTTFIDMEGDEIMGTRETGVSITDRSDEDGQPGEMRPAENYDADEG